MARGNKHTLLYFLMIFTNSLSSGKPQCVCVFMCVCSSISGERKMQKRMDDVPEPGRRSR